jgi:hypothetical protein
MPPEGYEDRRYRDFWDTLLSEQGVKVKVAEEVWRSDEYVSPYNVGDVLVGEIVEERKELA